MSVVETKDNATSLAMVERNGLRYKADKELRLRGMSFKRVRMDIRHCCVPNLATNFGSPNVDVVLVAKHLCGVATDYAVLSVNSFNLKGAVKSGVAETECVKNSTEVDISPNFHGLAIATCCHHACAWKDYPGADWLSKRHGFTSAEFDIIKHWSGWAHTLRVKSNATAESLRNNSIIEQSPCSANVDIIDVGGAEVVKEDEEDTDFEHIVEVNTSIPRPSGLSYTEMSIIGKMIKRIIDQGRVEFLRNLGINAHQVRYCDPLLSPECFMIVSDQIPKEF